MDISQISTNFLRKLNTGPQRKRRKIMPRDPEDEKCPPDVIGAAVMIGKIATGEIQDGGKRDAVEISN
jgi:hypothetical protein